ncbi:MAG: PilN domain-containing protein [Chloroflexota bacterium]|nr:PilN domain-containing protein [Dehalococcoidia bacterium]MDW8254764.1 PilN domain-containing protein [Chloroflexota bacterium]
MAISSAARPPVERRPRPIDLNLLPPAYRRRTGAGLAPVLALVLLTLAVGALMFLQLRLRAEDELIRWSARLSRAQTTRAALAVVDATAQEYQGKLASLQQQLDALQNDYQELNQRRVSWSQVYQAILTAAPADMGFSTIQQRNYQVLIQGTGSSDASITGFAQKLSSSPLFASVVLQNISEAPPGSGLPPVSAGPPPVLPPQPTPMPAPQPTATPPPLPTVTILPPLPTPTRPAAATPTSAPPAAAEFRVVSSIRTTIPGNVDRPSLIRGKIVDENEGAVRGITVRLTGEGISEERTASDGTFEFQVPRKGVYAVTLVGVRADAASGLSTNVPGVTGFHIWDITFKRLSGRAGSSRPAPPEVDGHVITAAALLPPEEGPRTAERPPLATYTFTIVAQVRPGAGQVPVFPTPPPTATTAPTATTSSAVTVTAPSGEGERRFGARP